MSRLLSVQLDWLSDCGKKLSNWQISEKSCPKLGRAWSVGKVLTECDDDDAENTHRLGKDHCTPGLPFNKTCFDQKCKYVVIFLKNGPFPASFSYIFVFSNIHYNSYNKCKWKNVCSIWRGDSNPRPLDHESPPITTRPGLPPKICCYLCAVQKWNLNL